LGIGDHQHSRIQEFKAGEFLELYASIQIPTTKGAGSDPYCHSGGRNPTGYLTQFSCDIDI